MKMKSTLRHLAWVALLLPLAGCASWTPPVKKTEAPADGYAYFYGKFKVDSPHVPLSFDGYSTIGFEFLCSDGKRYTFRFDNTDSLQVLKVKPAKCSLRWIIFTDGDGSIRGTHEVPADLFHDIDVKAGSAYYFGDYAATVASGGYSTGWHIDSSTDQFDQTSADLKLAYPGLAKLTLVDQIQFNGVEHLKFNPTAPGG